jgi:hypothetical protein
MYRAYFATNELDPSGYCSEWDDFSCPGCPDIGAGCPCPNEGETIYSCTKFTNKETTFHKVPASIFGDEYLAAIAEGLTNLTVGTPAGSLFGRLASPAAKVMDWYVTHTWNATFKYFKCIDGKWAGPYEQTDVGYDGPRVIKSGNEGATVLPGDEPNKPDLGRETLNPHPKNGKGCCGV